jgi:hypothetical protein
MEQGRFGLMLTEVVLSFARWAVTCLMAMKGVKRST